MLSKKSWGVVMSVGMFSLFFLFAWSSRAEAFAIRDVHVNVWDFETEEEAMGWLQQYAMENDLTVEDLLCAQQHDESSFEACINTTITPSSISTTVPKSIQIIQVLINVKIGDCGMVLCSTMGFAMTWDPGPSTGAMIFGPSPSQTRDQICVGNSITSKGMLLLQKTVPKGNYRLKIKVGGFGSAVYYYVPVTIS